MSRLKNPFLTLILLFTMATAFGQDTQLLMLDIVKKWEGNKSYTIAVIEAMPEEHFDFKPITEMKTFREQVQHIVNTFSFKMEKLEHDGISELDTTSKATTITSMSIIFDEIIAYFRTLTDDFLSTDVEMWYGISTKNRLVQLLDNHLAHHRGQLIVYLRLNGIIPPKYIGW